LDGRIGQLCIGGQRDGIRRHGGSHLDELSTIQQTLDLGLQLSLVQTVLLSELLTPHDGAGAVDHEDGRGAHSGQVPDLKKSANFKNDEFRKANLLESSAHGLLGVEAEGEVGLELRDADLGHGIAELGDKLGHVLLGGIGGDTNNLHVGVLALELGHVADNAVVACRVRYLAK
jgi:hypothetical protein